MRSEESIKKFLDMLLLQPNISQATKRIVQAIILWILDENSHPRDYYHLYNLEDE